MQVLSSLSGITFYAPSAGFAPTNSADVSAIASAYQVVSATATQLYAGTAYVTSVNDNQISASRAGQAANASMANSAYYDGTGRLISALPDSATVSAIASSYAESAASSKQDTLTFGYNAEDKISSIDGSAIAGGEGGGLVTALGTGQDPWYQTSISSINGMNLSAQWADSADNAHAADIATSATYAQTADFATTVAPWVVSAYISAVTSRSGTIIVTNRTGIDATDSAVVGEYVPGYSGVSTYGGNLVPFNGIGSAIFTGIPDSLPVTASLAMMYGAPDTVTFSGSNGTTASASYAGSPTALTADLGKVSSVYVYTQNQYIQQYGLTYTADAIDNASIVALAHASALPTYQYDAEDKISGINGSAIAGGGAAGVDSATCSAIASAYAESAVSGKADSSALSSYVPYSSLEYNTASAISGINGSALAAGSTYSAGEGIDITDDVISVETPVDIVAGPGIVIDNPDGNTLRVSTDENYETVLWTGTLNTLNSNIECSENLSNFSTIKIFYRFVADSVVQSVGVHEFEPSEMSSGQNVSFGGFYLISNNFYGWWIGRLVVTDGYKVKITNTKNSWGTGSSPSDGTTNYSTVGFIYKIVGIHRIANN